MEATSLRSIETTSPGSGPAPGTMSPSVAAARIVRRLRQAIDWQPEIDEILELLGPLAVEPTGPYCSACASCRARA